MAETTVALGGDITLAQKLANVMRVVTHVEKKGRNEFHKYDYAREADIVAPVRKALAEQGVAVLPTIKSKEWVTVQKKDKTEFICRLELEVTFADGKETFVVSALGEGQDPGDKAAYKAMTGAIKYAISKAFLIPTGDDPELDSDDDKADLVTKVLGSSGVSPEEEAIAVIMEFDKPEDLKAYCAGLKAKGHVTSNIVEAFTKRMKELTR